MTPVGQLGVGKQQLVEIAKALSKDVRLLILDEPTAALNDTDSAHLLGLLRRLKERGITSIMISHKLNEITAIADRVDRHPRRQDGRDARHCTPARSRRSGSSAAWSAATWRALPRPDVAPRRGGAAGRGLDRLAPHPGPQGRRRRHVQRARRRGRRHRRAHGRRAHRARDERLRPLLRPGHLRPALHARQGDQGAQRGEAIDHGIAYATEDRKRYGLNLIEDIRRNVSAAALGKLSPRGWVNGNEEIKVAEESRRSMNIKAPSVMSVVGKLSGGNQQKVVLSKWLFTDPDVLILDEPTRGIDVGAKYEIYTIINKLVADGKAVVVISSELPELLGICDRIYTLRPAGSPVSCRCARPPRKASWSS